MITQLKCRIFGHDWSPGYRVAFDSTGGVNTSSEIDLCDRCSTPHDADTEQ